MPPPKKNKSLIAAYLCWITGGLFGLHHFYLGRDMHAFITFCTAGGYFSLGVIRDLWRLPEYVADANNDQAYLDRLHDKMHEHSRPPSSTVRQIGMMIVGNVFAYLVTYAIPEDLFHPYVYICLIGILAPFASALGVWIVGNVGRQKGDILKPLIASYVSIIPALIIRVPFASLSTIFAAIVFNKFSKEWRRKNEKPRRFVSRITWLSIYIMIYLFMWTSWLYNGCTIEDPETHEIIKCRVAWENFCKSPAYANLYEAFHQLYLHVKHNGFSTLWEEIIQEFDVSGKSSALTVLGLDDSATPEQILAQYKKLSRQYHPDKVKDESKKQEQQEMFIQVQAAFQTLKPRVDRHNHRHADENS